MNHNPNNSNLTNIDDFGKQISILKKKMLKFINKNKIDLPLLDGYLDDLLFLLNDYMDNIAISLLDFTNNVNNIFDDEDEYFNYKF
jgi:hypothetical protein